MPSIAWLIDKLTAAYPAITFIKGDDFRWSPTEQTIYYAPNAHSDALLLHETSHYLLGHQAYETDIDLLKMERDAWYKAQQLAEEYGVTIDEGVLQAHLDSYRDWLHARSTCPTCNATGHQTSHNHYHCVACGTDWRVNEARLCGLKRYKVGTK